MLTRAGDAFIHSRMKILSGLSVLLVSGFLASGSGLASTAPYGALRYTDASGKNQFLTSKNIREVIPNVVLAYELVHLVDCFVGDVGQAELIIDDVMETGAQGCTGSHKKNLITVGPCDIENSSVKYSVTVPRCK